MSERFQAYFEKLEGLSIEELDRSVTKLVLVEKEQVALVSPTSRRSRGERASSSRATRTSSSTVSAACT